MFYLHPVFKLVIDIIVLIGCSIISGIYFYLEGWTSATLIPFSCVLGFAFMISYWDMPQLHQWRKSKKCSKTLPPSL
jgi:hypothetical protein